MARVGKNSPNTEILVSVTVSLSQNQDNVEKVLRDERIHKEKVEETKEHEKQKLRELNMEVLTTSRLIGEPHTEKDEELKRFNLFENMDIALAEEEKRRALRQQKEVEEALKMRQQGVAPWRLGDGSSEANGVEPWYHRPPTTSAEVVVMGKNVTGEAAELARARDSSRKRSLDPMSAFLIDRGIEDIGVSAESKEEEDDVVSGGGGKKEEYARHNKKQRKEEKKKRKKEKKHRSKSRSASPVRGSGGDEDDFRSLLRRKRLEREIFERKKAAVALAKADIYGSVN